jgi:hypothetical protein
MQGLSNSLLRFGGRYTQIQLYVADHDAKGNRRFSLLIQVSAEGECHTYAGVTERPTPRKQAGLLLEKRNGT